MRRLGIDFGVSGTVIAETIGSGNEEKVLPVLSEPNLVHMMEDGSRIRGQEVVEKGLTQSVSTARHMRHYILINSPVAVRSGSYAMTYKDLGRDLLVSLIRKVAERGEDVHEVVFSLPHSAPGHYREWLASVVAEARIPEYSFTDELTAAARGYDVAQETDQGLMVIDFGSENIEVTVARLQQPSQGGTRSDLVVAHASSDTGTQSVARWIADDVLARCPNGWRPQTRTYPDGLLDACNRALEDLLVRDTIVLQVKDKNNGKISESPLSRADLDAILRKQDLFGILDSTITRACDLAQVKGYDLPRIRNILMTGSGSTIPSVQAAVESRFGTGKVRNDSPCSVIAAGASRHHPGASDKRSLRRDYALRYWNADTSGHEYRYIARRGTRYPTLQDTARILISAAYDGQVYLGIALYTFGDVPDDAKSQAIELVTDSGGKTRCIELSIEHQATRATCINERTPTILAATPPGKKGEVRFELAFRIDSQGFLLLNARDVMTGGMILTNHSCAKLT